MDGWPGSPVPLCCLFCLNPLVKLDTSCGKNIGLLSINMSTSQISVSVYILCPRVPKNWCFWIVVLEKSLESPLDCKEIQPVRSEGDQLWDFFGRNDAKLKLQYFGHLMRRVDSLEKTDAGRDWGQEEKGTTEDEMAGWHHWLNGCESEWTPGVGDGQCGLACCDSWGRKESEMTEQLNLTELNLQ